MAFTTKDWKDAPNASTPISAAALEDMETRLSNYSDTKGAFTVPDATPSGVGLEFVLVTNPSTGLVELDDILYNGESV